MKRITTAREQFDLLSPWLITASPKNHKAEQLELFGLGNPEMDFSAKDIGPREVPPPKGKKPPIAAPPAASAEGTQLELPFWMQNDWRSGDGGRYQSDVRPQIPEVDAPHPSEFLAPERWERQKATLKDPDYDPHGILPDNLSFEDIVQGEMKHIVPLYGDRDESGREKRSAQEGRWWYPIAHQLSKMVSDKTIGDHDRTIAEWSAFSPKNEWDINIENGMQFSLNYPGRPGRAYDETKVLHGDPELVPPPSEKRKPGFDPDKYHGPLVFPMPAMNVEDAQAIRHAPGDSFLKFLTGPKRQSFFRNIKDQSKMRDPRPGHDPVEDGGYYEMPTNPYTGEPDWRMHPMQLATMDTQHHRMTLAPPDASDEDLAGMKYETQPWFSKKKIIDGPQGRRSYELGYELQHRAHWEALRRLNAAQQDPHKHLLPPQAQAGPWLSFRKRLDEARERVTGKVPRKPGQLPKGVKSIDRPPQRGQSLGVGEEGPAAEYDATGIQEPQQESGKGHHYPRYQRDYAYEGDPDYSVPPEYQEDPRYLEPSSHYRHKEHPQKKLPGRHRHVPGTEDDATPRDPRNEFRDPRTLRNWDRRAMRFWQAGIQDDKYPQHWMDGAEQLARGTGGFTIHDEPGDGPTKGYQVAVPGYERTDINTGQGWADFAHEINPVLQGEGGALGTWFNPDDEQYYTEPSENFQGYDDAARATVDRNQWSMWDNGAFRINPKTKEKEFFPQADIPRHDIINQGLAGALGFTMAKRLGTNQGHLPLSQVRRLWEG